MRLVHAAAIAALSLSIGSAACAQAASETILVWSYGFSPHPIHLAAGRQVTLNFVNRSGSGHDFTAGSFFAHSTIVSGDVRDGKVDLGPNQTRSVTLIPGAGSYQAHCSHFFHKEMGMSVDIVVN